MNISDALAGMRPTMLRDFPARLRSSPLGTRLSSGVFWSLTGSLLARLFTLMAGVLAARVLGKETYGEFGIIQGTIAIFETLAHTGMGLTATKFVAEFRHTDPMRAGRIMALAQVTTLIMGAVFSIGLVLAAPLLAAYILAAPQLAGSLRIAGVLIFLSILNSSQIGVLAGLEAFRAIALVNLVSGLCTLPLLVGGVIYGGTSGGVWALAACMAVTCAVTNLALRGAAKGHIKPDYFDCFDEWHVLVSFSLPTVFAVLVGSLANWIGVALLVNQPSGYAELGVFTAAQPWALMPLYLPARLAAASFPILAQLYGSRQHQAFMKLLAYSMLFTFSIAFAVAAVISLLSARIMSSYGDTFSSSAPVLILLSFSTVLSCTIGVLGPALAAANRMWAWCWLNGLWALLYLTIAWLLRDYGAWGLALASLLSYSLHAVTVGGFAAMVLRHTPAVAQA